MSIDDPLPAEPRGSLAAATALSPWLRKLNGCAACGVGTPAGAGDPDPRLHVDPELFAMFGDGGHLIPAELQGILEVPNPDDSDNDDAGDGEPLPIIGFLCDVM